MPSAHHVHGGDTARGGKAFDTAVSKEYEGALAAALGIKAGSSDLQRFAATVINPIIPICLHWSLTAHEAVTALQSICAASEDTQRLWAVDG